MKASMWSVLLLTCLFGGAAVSVSCSGVESSDENGDEGSGGGNAGEDGSGNQAGEGPQGGSGTEGQGGEAGSSEGGRGGESSEGGNGGEVGSSEGGSGGEPNNGGNGGGENAGGNMAPNEPPPEKDCGDLAFCTDFERDDVGSIPGTLDAQLSTFISGGNTMAVATDRKASGNKSVKMQIKGGESNLVLSLLKLRPNNKKNSNHVRFKYFLDKKPGHTTYWPITWRGVHTSGGKTYSSNISFRQDHDRARVIYWASTSHDGEECFINSNESLPVGKWVCLEMAIDSATGQAYRVKVDGQVMHNLNFAPDSNPHGCHVEGSRLIHNSFPVPNVLSVRLGWTSSVDSHTPVTMWVDDVAFDTEPIGCN